jgi:hypothetical protein
VLQPAYGLGATAPLGELDRVLCVWGICVDGRQGLLPLSTTNRESDERGLEGVRDLSKRGLQTPVTICARRSWLTVLIVTNGSLHSAQLGRSS